MLPRLLKYPRTPHVEGSQLQKGDEDLTHISFSTLAQIDVVVEEKVDAANAGVRFQSDGRILLQSRGHYLSGGASESQFDLLKQWAGTHTRALWDVLGDRFILYGEWLYAKHTIFYNALEHYFLAFDIYDCQAAMFLSRERRLQMLNPLPVRSVPLVFEGRLERYQHLVELIGESAYINPTTQESDLRQQCEVTNINFEQCLFETDTTGLMEGVYIKVESKRQVLSRAKFVRGSFKNRLDQSEGHWKNHPLIPNRLSSKVNIFV